ncbi:MAG: hypothetical protein IGR93_01170 [Hydrococcus sp. C42_A2020_068]|nr:hypothetical protein [Pleurocapsa sp. PCC 7327]AFY76456.1 hypothetical protein Ple7327_1041 [Pleurocapsa sp. PCC 7327]MBF2018743.1 hypothetical protein [Hydrococcus sp. C42_A2020_068]
MQLTRSNVSYQSKLNKSDWYFIPTTLSGATGVIIGLAIANFLGWI